MTILARSIQKAEQRGTVMKRISRFHSFIRIAIIGGVVLLLTAMPLLAKGGKDIILVLDTSLSMAGFGGKNIIGDVKRSIGNYIDKNVQDGDRVTFMTFDTEVRTYPTVFVDDDNDRDILKKYISMIQASGKWTYTYKMILSVFEKAEELEKKKDGRQTMIVVMTDAIDDPPPGSKDHWDIKNISKKYGQKDWWVYLVAFNDLKSNDKLRNEIARVAKNTKMINETEPDTALGKEMAQDVKKLEAESQNRWIWVVVALLVLLLILALIIIIRKMTNIKVTGRLEYWNTDVIEPYIVHFDLGKRGVKQALIGKGAGCLLHIRDINLKAPFVLKAVRHGGAVRLQLSAPEGSGVEVINRESPDGFIEDGDMIKATNYTFKYFAS